MEHVMVENSGEMVPFTLDGIPYAVAHCQACFDLQGNGDLLDITKC